MLLCKTVSAVSLKFKFRASSNVRLACLPQFLAKWGKGEYSEFEMLQGKWYSNNADGQ